MERLNWAVLGLMGIVTALGLATSSGEGNSKNELPDGTKISQVVDCSPIGGAPVSDNTPIELAASVPASSHSGCAACQAKKAQAANEIASAEKSSKKAPVDFDGLIDLVGSRLGDWKVNSDPACPGNCQETGVCCDKSLNKGSPALIAKVETPICESECPLKAADAITNLTKNYVCEGGECLTKQGHGTLTITAADPAPAKPEGLLNLVAAAEAAKPDAKPESGAGEIVTGGFTVQTNPPLNLTTSTLTLSATADTSKAASGTLTIIGTGIVPESKPAVDHSRAAARAAKLAKIEEKMEAPWKWEFERVGFEELVEIVQVNLNVPVMVDRKAIEEMAYDTASTFKIEKQPEMESAQYLRQKLLEHGLTWVIPASNDCVLITSMSAMENMRLNRVFDVTDLVNDADFNGDELVSRIESLIEPNTWRASGGPGDVAIWKTEKRLCLISSNNYWVQREVANLIEDLRLDSPKNSDHAAAKTAVDPVAVLRRYELPAQPDVKDPLDRHKVLQAQQAFLLSVLKDLPQFNAEVFVATEYNLRPVLVTKQLPEVHNKIKQRLKELAVARSVFF